MSASVLVMLLALGAGPLAPTDSGRMDPCKCCAGELVKTVLDEEGRSEEVLAALKTLRECPSETVKTHFPRLLRELTDPRLRRLAAMTLAEHGEKAGLEELRTLLEREPELHERVALASLLVSYGDPTGYSSVVSGLDSDEPRLRQRATSLLSRFVAFESDVGANLRKALQDSVPQNRIEALNGIVAAVNDGLSHEEVEEAVKRIRLNDPEEGVREVAQRTLELIDPKTRQRLEILRRYLEKGKDEPGGRNEGTCV